MTRTATFQIAGGARVVVPDSLNSITPYVLFEQNDWFEDEIVFLRCLLAPGQRAIDVGANYGVYTLSIAQLVGPTGAVWAFEPASSTADFLAQGVAANNFGQVSIQRCALSNNTGTAHLSLNDNSELNALTRTTGAASTETVRVTTLDDCLIQFGWNDITLMKIDAEGEEVNIIKGGREFFASQSPLILYEVKAGTDLHLELVSEFEAIGYNSYRLVPGLNMLVPFLRDSRPDGYLLNLFCCKPDRAALLGKLGYLASSVDLSASAREVRSWNFSLAQNRQYAWRNALVSFPYATTVATLWEQLPQSTDSDSVVVGLAQFAVSQDDSLPPSTRFSALESSFHTMEALCRERPRHLRLLSLARIARAYGARAEAVAALGKLLDGLAQGDQPDFTEPFLAPGKRFDTVPPGTNLQAWLLAAILEELERLVAYSSFFSGINSKSRLEKIESLGFGSSEMKRRLQLVQLRFPTTTQ